MFNLEIQKLQMFIAGNIWKKCRDFLRSPPARSSQNSSFHPLPSMQYFAASLSGPPSPGAGLSHLAGRWVRATRQFDGKNDDSPVDLGKTNPDMAMECYGSIPTNTIRDEHPSIPAILMRAKGIPWLLTHPNFCRGHDAGSHQQIPGLPWDLQDAASSQLLGWKIEWSWSYEAINMIKLI